jgi:hypothetical protein
MMSAASWALAGITLAFSTISLKLAGQISAGIAVIGLIIGCYASRASRDPQIDSALSIFEEFFATQFIRLGLWAGLVSACLWVDILFGGDYRNTGASSLFTWTKLWLLYGLAILMAWLEDLWITRDRDSRPGLFLGRAGFIFLAIRLAVTYGTLIGLWRISGLKMAMIAFAAYFLFQQLTIRFYYNQELRRQIDLFVCSETKEHEERNLPFEEPRVREEAVKSARFKVMQNLKE